jgi:hypothetical protein
MRSDNVKRVLPDKNTRFGAPMGRGNKGTKPENEKIYDKRVPMIDGAYDIGGAYWGIGNQLRVKFNKSLTYIEFYRR